MGNHCQFLQVVFHPHPQALLPFLRHQYFHLVGPLLPQDSSLLLVVLLLGLLLPSHLLHHQCMVDMPHLLETTVTILEDMVQILVVLDMRQEDMVIMVEAVVTGKGHTPLEGEDEVVEDTNRG